MVERPQLLNVGQCDHSSLCWSDASSCNDASVTTVAFEERPQLWHEASLTTAAYVWSDHTSGMLELLAAEAFE